MKVTADLHIHSRYSRATSAKLTLPHLERWARIKGIGLAGTGDCTHPIWLGELRSLMDDAEEGLYMLKPDERRKFNSTTALTEGLPMPGVSACEEADPVNAAAENPEIPRFVLTGEISTIYKKGDKTRKIHHLVILPDFKAAAAFNTRLEGAGGNIRSDGRPILGMDSRDLLALLLEADERALLIPAHIWTPWFSALGANSGFDSIDECYRDLARYIPAVETGLSSNPPMNWALKSLDRYAIISNSDAHSPEKLGREATLFDMELSYPSLRKALDATSTAFPSILGTVEFFPQEGKYHYDGHRKCGVSLKPDEAAEADYRCPVCGKTMTRGVMGRVRELADRPVNEEEACPDDYRENNRRPYHSLIPLKEIIAELLGTGTSSKKTEIAYSRLIEKGGSEFSILMDKSRRDLERLSIPELSGEILAEGILKMRGGDVFVEPGYDGEYGKVRVFPAGILPKTAGLADGGLFGAETNKTIDSQNAAAPVRASALPRVLDTVHASTQNDIPSPPVRSAAFLADQAQAMAVSHNGRETIIIAGPGTGKTKVLTERIGRIIKEGADPASILALTFTVKAAAELRERIGRAGGPAAPCAMTFHSFCCTALREHAKEAGLPGEFRIIAGEERDALLRESGGKRAGKLGSYIEERKRFLLLPGEKTPGFAAEENADSADALRLTREVFGQWEFPEADGDMEILYKAYRKTLKKISCLDFEDLSAGTVRLLASRPGILGMYRQRFRHIFVDEYQDINFSQYLLIRLLAPGGTGSPNLFVIGDPNQAIYGFRGSDKRFIDRFLSDYPEAGHFVLSRSFRCAEPIISAAGRLAGTRLEGRAVTPNLKKNEVSLYRSMYAAEKDEAEGIARTIAALIGGTSFFAMDSGAAGENPSEYGNQTGSGNYSPGDCAILVRASTLAVPIIRSLKNHGIPFDLSGEMPWWKEDPAKAIIEILRARKEAEKELTVEASPEKKAEDSIKDARNELSKRKKDGVKKQIDEAAEKLTGLAVLFGGLSTLLDTFDSCAMSGIPEPGFELAGSQENSVSLVMRNDAVRIMTIHASKGLEFEQVFVPGLEEGILPFTLFDKNKRRVTDIEEERRLLYVAMTRAKQGLWLSSAQSRIFKGRKLNGNPSRFLLELEKIIPLISEGKPRSVTRNRDGQLNLF